MSGGLAPSKSTVYVGNLPFSLTNNDLHKVFERFGKIAKVTILRDKVTRISKGVAFVQYVEKDSAINCCKQVNEKILFERKIKCTIAKDNGRAAEFIRKKEYPDKSSCYECGDTGHLSYDCPKNILGNREPPPKKEKKTKKEKTAEKERSKNLIRDYYDEGDANKQEEELGEDPYESSLSYAIELESKYNQDKGNLKRQQIDEPTTSSNTYSSYNSEIEQPVLKKKRIKQSSYFSDEEEEDD